ncbi:SOS response-associated peptidase [Pelagerythrobacter sp.]|uniref:SOS response-associated peptidase n=1 Tax=Pelagerythrobacter sp. TaxID=2800702 RepID=UPI0035B099C6
MCNLYGMRASRDEVAAHFRANDEWPREVTLEKDYVAPGKPGWIVREEAGARVLDTMLWGFPFQGKPVTNVRNYGSPFWRSALQEPSRRCLVPVTRFQEWSAAPDPATGKKRPYWFNLRAQPIFAFAGIWRPAEPSPFFSFLTTGYEGDPAAHAVGAIHPKAIPVILHEEDHDRWLHAEIDDALELAAAFPSQLIEVAAG